MLGATIERGADHLDTLRIVRPGFDLETERRARAAAGRPDELRPVDFHPDARPCIDALRDMGLTVGAAGNTDAATERLLRDHLGLELVASSAGLGVAKPAPAFFAAIAELAGVEPGRIAYVGDRVDNDVEPALAAGMVAVHIRRGPWGHLHAEWPAAADAHLRIDSLAELPAGLSALPDERTTVRLNDDGFVHDQYASTAKLETRIAVWQPAAAGRSPQDVAIARLAARAPARLLEVGPGTGAFAERCRMQLRCEVVALDSSAEMVRATAARGITAIVGDVAGLPFAAGEFDCAVAAWMLYHVPDLDTAIAELARVLAPGGRLVAITNGDEHLRELYAAVGGTKLASSFSRENGAAQLARHFARVDRIDLEARAVFADRAAAAAYLATLGQEELAARLPDFSEPFVASGAPTVFVADRA